MKDWVILPKTLSYLQQDSFFNVKVASGSNVKILGQNDVKLKTIEHKIDGTFVIFHWMNSVVESNIILQKYCFEISPEESLSKLPKLIEEVNYIKPASEGRKTVVERPDSLVINNNAIFKPQHEQFLRAEVEFW